MLEVRLSKEISDQLESLRQQDRVALRDLWHQLFGRLPLEEFLQDKPPQFRERQDRLQEIVKDMQVQFLSYAEFVAFLENAAPPVVDQSPGAEVYRKLIGGLCKEIKDRHLA
jgi:hypothetical protein